MTSPSDKFDRPLTDREHLDPDKHFIGETLPVPSQIRSILIVNTNELEEEESDAPLMEAYPGVSPFPAREDHVHDVDLTDYVRRSELPDDVIEIPTPTNLSNYYTKDEINELLLLWCQLCAAGPDPITGQICWYEWRVEVFNASTGRWSLVPSTPDNPTTGFLQNATDPIPFNLDSLDPAFAYQLSVREICDAVPSPWTTVPFRPVNDWLLACNPELSPSLLEEPFSNSVFAIPVICGTGVTP